MYFKELAHMIMMPRKSKIQSRLARWSPREEL